MDILHKCMFSPNPFLLYFLDVLLQIKFSGILNYQKYENEFLLLIFAKRL